MTAALLRLAQLDALVYAQLGPAVLVVKHAYALAEGSDYEDDEDGMESEALHRVRELTNQHMPDSGKWEFRHVSSMADAPVIRAALKTMGAAANPSYTAGIKTRVCVHFMRNSCKNADQCEFAHAEDELSDKFRKDWKSFKTVLCKNHPNCTHGLTCLFAHGQRELRQPPAAGSEPLSPGWTAFRNDFISALPGAAADAHLGYMRAAQDHVQHAATNPHAAIQALRYLRNVVSHLRGTVLINGISEESYDFVSKTVAAAGSCLAAALASKPAVFQGAAALPSKPTVFQCTAREFSPGAAGFTPAAVPVHSTISTLNVDQVVELFAKHKFPTQGIVDNGIDGASLILMCQDIDHQADFCKPIPDGLGFTTILYKGRFRWEMHKLGVTFNPPYEPKVLPQRT